MFGGHHACRRRTYGANVPLEVGKPSLGEGGLQRPSSHASKGTEMMSKTAVLVVVLTMSSASQAKPKHLPISDYMREIGSTYLQKAQDLADICEDPTDKCSDVIDDWKKMMDAMEQKAVTALDGTHRPAGDVAFFNLLVKTRTEEEIYFSGIIILGKEDLNIHLFGYLNCQRHAQEDIKRGATNAILLHEAVLETDDRCEQGPN